jgi:hypothetical protein
LYNGDFEKITLILGNLEWTIQVPPAEKCVKEGGSFEAVESEEE